MHVPPVASAASVVYSLFILAVIVCGVVLSTVLLCSTLCPLQSSECHVIVVILSLFLTVP